MLGISKMCFIFRYHSFIILVILELFPFPWQSEEFLWQFCKFSYLPFRILRNSDTSSWGSRNTLIYLLCPVHQAPHFVTYIKHILWLLQNVWMVPGDLWVQVYSSSNLPIFHTCMIIQPLHTNTRCLKSCVQEQSYPAEIASHDRCYVLGTGNHRMFDCMLCGFCEDFVHDSVKLPI